MQMWEPDDKNVPPLAPGDLGPALGPGCRGPIQAPTVAPLPTEHGLLLAQGNTLTLSLYPTLMPRPVQVPKAPGCPASHLALGLLAGPFSPGLAWPLETHSRF